MGAPDPDATATAATKVPETPVKLQEADYARYEVLSELARGGHGRILRAHDRKLDRPVALKVPLAPEGAAQFAREAWITARLQHPAIVPVYEAGLTPEGGPFYAMKLVSGTSLRDVIAGRKTLAERLTLLPSVIAVADAVAYAHGRRVIHRDLKPSNVLVGDYGETVVLDWGVAKQLGAPDEAAAGPASAQATATGGLQGTPAYMAPEQARLEAVDERADVYALGALLHHVLTGQPPYGGANAAEVLARVTAGPPPDVAELAPGTPADLAAVVRKAMARDPAGRYPTAKELADELRRFQSGQMLSAHRYSAWQLLRRFVARYRTAVAVAVLMTAVLAVVAFASVRRIARERSSAETRRDQLLLLQAHEALAHDPTAAMAWLKQYPLSGAHWETARDDAARALGAGVALGVKRGFGWWFDVVPEQNRVVIRLDPHAVEVWDTETGQRRKVALPDAADSTALSPNGKELAIITVKRQLWRVPLDGSPARSVWQGEPDDTTVGTSWSPDGSWLVTQTGTGNLWLFDLTTGTRRVVHAHDALINSTMFSPDAKWFATASADKRIGIWNREGQGRYLVEHENEVRSARFSPDSRSLVSGSTDRTVRLWDVATGKGRVLGSHQQSVFWAEFSRDGKLVASGGQDSLVRLWPLDGGAPRELHGHTDSVQGVSFSLDGKRLASASDDRTVRVWDLEGGAVQVLRGHDGGVSGNTLAFLANGWLTSLSIDCALRVWPLRPQPARLLTEAKRGFNYIAISQDGTRVAAGGTEVHLCDWPKGTCRVLPGQETGVSGMAFSPDGKWLAAGDSNGAVLVWPTAGGPGGALHGHVARVMDVQFSPDSRELASVSKDRTLRLWNLATREGRVIDTLGDLAMRVCFTPDGSRLASSGFDGKVHVWERNSGSVRILPRPHTDFVMALACAPDGKHLVTGSFDKEVRLWDLDSGEFKLLGKHSDPIWAVGISFDGRWAASAGTDKLVKVWDLARGGVRTLAGHDAEVERMAFSRDGRWLATVGEEPNLRIWDLVGGEHLVLQGHEGPIHGVDFTPDGRFLATASLDGSARVFEIERLRRLPTDPAAVRDLIAHATFAEIDPGRPVADP